MKRLNLDLPEELSQSDLEIVSQYDTTSGHELDQWKFVVDAVCWQGQKSNLLLLKSSQERVKKLEAVRR